MKTTILAIFMVLFAAHSLVAQERHLWIGLSGNRVMLDVVLRSVQHESVIVSSDARLFEVRLDEVEQVRVIQGGLITRGALVGASAGVVVGGMIGYLAAPRDDRGWRAGTTALAVGIIGGIIGGVVESVPEKDEIIELRGKPTNARREIFEKILRQQAE